MFKNKKFKESVSTSITEASIFSLSNQMDGRMDDGLEACYYFTFKQVKPGDPDRQTGWTIDR